ncbi:MAG: shikimate dehydrogenase [Cyclobacteriaceae bacterium]
MRKFGLIGFPLGHSFSKKYFTEKFSKLGLADHQYDLFEMEQIDAFEALWNDDELVGLNVTVPHKENVMPFLTRLDHSAEKVGAVNVIKKQDEGLVGYNSDFYGFQQSLLKFLAGKTITKALILGTGGAAKAVRSVLLDMDVELKIVSRAVGKADLTYDQIMNDKDILAETDLIVNSTPLGTFPKVDNCPLLPYEVLHTGQFLYDLVYNPEETLFLKKGKEQGAAAKNGYDMLELQAERSWEIWND